ncbi:hypothetical protein BH23ACT5_BH23ACT5_08080 [soil metagenome]
MAQKKKSPGPSVKDDRRYEALRREGASKEKAARIANTDPKRAAEKGRELTGLRGVDHRGALPKGP